MTRVATRDVGTSFTRAQYLALTVAVLQVVSVVFGFMPVDTTHDVLQVFSGLLGCVLAWRPGSARLYGALLLVVYGALLAGAVDAAAGPYELVGTQPLLYLRTAIAGAAIAVVPPWR